MRTAAADGGPIPGAPEWADRAGGEEIKSAKRSRKQTLIFLGTFCLTLLLLTAGNQVFRQIRRQQMMEAAAASARKSDGAPNLAVLDGDSGYIGVSGVYLKYLGDGNVDIRGKNAGDEEQWKKLCELTLDAGTYTFTGLKGVAPDTLELQLEVEDASGETTCLWQNDEDVIFTLRGSSTVKMHVRIQPHVEIETVACPAVYRENEDA